eukprot:jgi/Bigna1/142921/aug1.74_g17629
MEAETIWGYPLKDTIKGTSSSRLTDLQQHNLGSMILDRVSRSNRCRALDPETADIYVVPMFSKDMSQQVSEREKDHVYEFAPDEQRLEIDELEERILRIDWASELKYLSKETATKHIILSPEMFGLLGFLEQNRRDRENFILEIGARKNTRPLLKFLWGTSEFHESTYWAGDLSQRMRSVSVIGPVKYISFPYPRFSKMEAALDAKRRSVFCLEPPGFGFVRKSVVDSLSLGCIPVIFMPNDDVWQKYWATLWSMSMKKDMAIMINGYDLVDGKISLYETLTSISAERVREMQKSISNNYHKLHYSNIDYPGDAMERLLHILKAFGAKREKPHVCRDLIKEPYGRFLKPNLT